MTNRHTQLLRRSYSEKSKKFDKKLLAIPIKSSDEDFYYLPKLCEEHKVIVVFNEKEKDFLFLRKSVALAFIQAANFFDMKGLTLKVESAYRSLADQKKRFMKRFALMKKRYPEKSKTELLSLANTYTAGIPVLASHTAGAAVDVILLGKDNTTFDFGYPYLHGDVESITDYPGLSKKAKANRKLLKEGMEKFGLMNYPFEYWHYSHGDVCAAYLTGQKYAKFGPVDYDLGKKTISLPKSHSELYEFFDALW